MAKNRTNNQILFPETSEKTLMDRWRHESISPGVKNVSFSGGFSLFPETSMAQDAMQEIADFEKIGASMPYGAFQNTVPANVPINKGSRQNVTLFPETQASAKMQEAQRRVVEKKLLAEDALKAKDSAFTRAEFDDAGNITSEISSRTKIAQEASNQGKKILANGYTTPGSGFAESYMSDGNAPSFSSKFDLGGSSSTKRVLDYDLGITTQKPGDFANTFELEAKDLTAPKIESNRKPFGKLADGTSVELSEQAARKITPKKKPLISSNEKMSSLGKLGKMALGGAVLGGVLMTMMSNGGHQSNEQLYGQQPVNR